MEHNLTIITISLSVDDGFRSTLSSILNQNNKNFKCILVISKTTQLEIDQLHLDDRFTVICNKDKSIYHALNLGLAASAFGYVFILNGGDTLYDNHSINTILKKISASSYFAAHQFNGLNHSNGDYYLKPGHLRKASDNNNHHIPSFIAPHINEEELFFDESKKINADIFWVKQKKNMYPSHFHDEVISIFELNGISSSPSIHSIKLRFNSIGIYNSIKEIFKFGLSCCLSEKYYFRVLAFFSGFRRYS